ncbi:MAG: hypothetical protein KY448_07045 [Cyanobacteria bacterium 0813]|nr:hypothetical protein [Cyanobacteria bacterium 0813]
MWQTTEPIELPLKALRLESLTLLRDLLSVGPAVDRQNPRAQACKHGRQIPNPTTAWNLSNVSTIGKIHSHCEPKGWRSSRAKPTQFPANFSATPRLLYH